METTRSAPIVRRLTLAVVYIAVAFLVSCRADEGNIPPPDVISTTSVSPARESTVASATAVPALATRTSTPVPSQSAAGDPGLSVEAFDDNRNGWFTKSALVTVADGKYRHMLNCPGSSPSLQCGNFIQVPFTFPSNFRMQIETTIVSLSDGASVMIGFQMRKSDDGYYYLQYVIPHGLYEMSRVTQTGAFTILSQTQTDLLALTSGETNILGVQIDGSQLTPLANGQELAPVSDGNIRTAGDAYLVVLVDRGHTAEVHFDNLVVERLE